MHLKHAFSKAYHFFHIFCELWVVTPSFFGMPLRLPHSICSPQLMHDNWLTSYCFMKKTKLFMRKIISLISRLFCIPISPTFCGHYSTKSARASPSSNDRLLCNLFIFSTFNRTFCMQTVKIPFRCSVLEAASDRGLDYLPISYK